MLSKNLEYINKNEVIDSHGVRYTEFRLQLKPIYSKVYLDIFFGYIGLILPAIFLAYFQKSSGCFTTIMIISSALLFGYSVAYIQLFFHEAAHFNLAKNRKINDFLANFFIGSLVGQSIAAYRVIHWNHHKYLGEIDDPENSYFDPLNIEFFLKAFFGIKVGSILLARKKRQKQKRTIDKVMLLIGLLLNGSFVLIAYLFGLWQLSIAWVLGMLMIFPFFAALRPLLEHRDELADKQVNYHVNRHGKVTRIFESGIFGSSFGGAGFRLHLLHHWDPAISYTQLEKVKAFLLDSNLKEPLQESTTDYFTTFIHLLRRSL